MLSVVSEREFHDLIVEKEDIIQARTGYVAPLTAALGGHWVAILEQPSSLILLYLMARTLSFGRAAERIAVREFVSGSSERTEVRWSPIPISTNTLRKHIKVLCDKDLLTIYSARSAVSDVESQPRMFEINCRKLFDIPLLESGRDDFFLQIEAQVTAEKEGVASQKLLSAPSQLGGGAYQPLVGGDSQ